ncbi:MAG TPA: energy transducer TonB [Blastocatellia bacterium]|nr:energy transducer TonB [Blastocatellia bacterium]
MASVATVDFGETSRPVDAPPFSLIEQKGLVKRLGEELTRAASELSRDPSAFFRGLFVADARDKKRRRLICAGLALGLVAQFVFLVVAAIAGWHRMLAPAKEPQPKVTMLSQNPIEYVDSTPTEKPPGSKDGGGGGGGQHTEAPASKGPLPQSVPQPQLVNPNPSNIAEPTLAVAPTIKGLESIPPPPAQVGDPNGQGSEFSGGPGSGDGIGSSKGPGVGKGNGPGGGPGEKGGRGGGTSGFPDGGRAQIAEVNFNDLASQPNYTPFSWIRRPKPAVTPEADENKVIGIVVLRATFHADGTISDVEVVMPVEHGMTESAIESLMRCKFRPATVNGRPITLRKVPIKIHVHYQQ